MRETESCGYCTADVHNRATLRLSDTHHRIVRLDQQKVTIDQKCKNAQDEKMHQKIHETIAGKSTNADMQATGKNMK